MSEKDEARAEAERRYPKKPFVYESHVQKSFVAGAEWQASRIIAPLFILPTKKWAQVLDVDGRLWTLFSDGRWFSLPMNWMTTNHLAKVYGLRIISEGVDDE
jgi:hypothetical protein